MVPTPKLSPGCSRIVPLPNFSWATAKDVWMALLQREQRYFRNPLMLSRHPGLQPRMRSIVLNWISEVCELYKLHRETYYSAVDIFDRYLSVQTNVAKEQLQLISVTCLFLAAKKEEIYPPKVVDFAYVTDGACSVEQIVAKELVILTCLKWKLSTITVNSWLTIYMQLYALLEKEQLQQPPRSPINDSSEPFDLKADKNGSTSDQDVIVLDTPVNDKNATIAPPKKRKRVISNSPNLSEANRTKTVTPSTSTGQASTSVVLADKSNAQPDNKSESGSSSQGESSDNEQGTSSRKPKKDFISSILGRGNEETGEKFMRQRYNPYFFAQVAHLLDLSMLDIGSLRFSYNVISAAALYHFTNLNTVLQCTGLKLERIQECIMWMTPFALAIRDEGFEQLKLYKSANPLEDDIDQSNIQTNTVDLKLLEKAQMKNKQQQQMATTAERNVQAIEPPSSPASMPPSASQAAGTTIFPAIGSSSPMKSPVPSGSNILTPPRSHSKQTTPV